VQGWRQNGKLYAIPFNGQNSAFVVNRGLLRQVGINSLPRSMGDVRAAAKLVKDKTGKTGLVILDNLFHISQYVYAFGGSWNGGKTINSANNVQGLRFLVDLFVKDKSAATAKQLGASWDGEAFAKGSVAFSTGGPWYIGYMATAGPSVDYQLMPIPASTPGKSIMVTYGGGLSIFADVSHKDAAMKLIEYLVRDKAMELMITGSLQYLPAKTKYMNEYIRVVPKFAPLRSGFFHRR
jgi:multiple sugar transport system substrate-binding protein